jgi:group II intron reverse transcriptase/maturase
MTRLHAAFMRVKRNGGAPGVDGVTIEMYAANLEQNLAALMYDLKHRGQYHAHPLRRVYIPKGQGQYRALGIPIVRDRVAQEVVRALLEPLFEPTFVEDSYGFRPGRNAHQAIKAILEAYQDGAWFVVDADIDGGQTLRAFFDHLPHNLILDRVAEKVADGNILYLLREFLTAEVQTEDGIRHPVDRGTPQGGVISPLLANIVLHVLDTQMIHAGFRCIRYADDADCSNPVVVLCPSLTSAEQALTLVKQTVQQLGLSLSPEKTRLTIFYRGFDFLGFHITSRNRSIRAKSVEKFKKHLTRMGLVALRDLALAQV